MTINWENNEFLANCWGCLEVVFEVWDFGGFVGDFWVFWVKAWAKTGLKRFGFVNFCFYLTFEIKNSELFLGLIKNFLAV